MPKKEQTSWGNVAGWYDELLSGDDTYQTKVILPNLLRMMDIKKGEKILDIGCGTGFFSRKFFEAGANVTGVDVGAELLKIAKEKNPKIDYVLSGAEKMELPDEVFDKAVMVLSLQNIAGTADALSETKRILKNGGKLFIVLNHPAFRIPQNSSWGWDEQEKIQYRRLDNYLSEKKIKIQMHPGEKPDEVTWSYHRPLQYYFKVFFKNGLLVERLEEWISHKKTEAGPRKEAEDRARAEFPMFLAISLVKHKSP